MHLAIVVSMILIISVLTVYAGWLLYRLCRQRRVTLTPSVQEYVPPASNSHSLGHRESIEVLARCVLQKQVSATEAAIRITALSRALPESETDDEFYAAFAQLASATAHIPILEAWQALDNAQRKAFEKERLDIEKAHHTNIVSAATALLTVQ